MGIYDRDYYRKEGPSFLDTFARRGRVVRSLIFVNVVIFALQVMTSQPGNIYDDEFGLRAADTVSVTSLLSLNTDKVWHGEIWRLLTYAFLHETTNIWHIVINMLFLWWFGSDMEDLYGPREFLAFYLTGALLGGLAFQVARIGEPARCIGASGAVMAVSVLCAFHYPTRTILVFFFLPMQLWLVVLLRVVYDAWAFLTNAPTGTAVAVHLAGAAFGLAYYESNIRLLNYLPDLAAWRRERSRPRLRVYRDEEPREQPVPVAAPPVASAADVDEQLEAKLDAVLEKVARFGQSSLTDTERQILFRASEIYKRRRTLDT